MVAKTLLFLEWRFPIIGNASEPQAGLPTFAITQKEQLTPEQSDSKGGPSPVSSWSGLKAPAIP